MIICQNAHPIRHCTLQSCSIWMEREAAEQKLIHKLDRINRGLNRDSAFLSHQWLIITFCLDSTLVPIWVWQNTDSFLILRILVFFNHWKKTFSYITSAITFYFRPIPKFKIAKSPTIDYVVYFNERHFDFQHCLLKTDFWSCILILAYLITYIPCLVIFLHSIWSSSCCYESIIMFNFSPFVLLMYRPIV